MENVGKEQYDLYKESLSSYDGSLDIFTTTSAIGLFGVQEKQLVGALLLLLTAVLFWLNWVQCCRACLSMRAIVKSVLRTIAVITRNALCPSVCQDPAKAVIGVVFVDKSQSIPRKRKERGHLSTVRRRWSHATPSALIFFALALFCGVDGGWAAFTPFTPEASEVGKAKEALFASFDNETNRTVLRVPVPIIQQSWDAIDPEPLEAAALEQCCGGKPIKPKIENLQRLIMKSNPPPEDKRGDWKKKDKTVEIPRAAEPPNTGTCKLNL